jgi:hypothetical protein
VKLELPDKKVAVLINVPYFRCAQRDGVSIGRKIATHGLEAHLLLSHTSHEEIKLRVLE